MLSFALRPEQEAPPEPGKPSPNRKGVFASALQRPIDPAERRSQPVGRGTCGYEEPGGVGVDGLMDADVERLLHIIDEAVGRLRQQNEDILADWLEKDRRRIAALDFDGLLHLLSAFSGVGSIGTSVTEPQTDQLLT